MSNTKYILLHETPLQSWKRDASTFVLGVAWLLPGWYLGIWSLTFLGFLCLIYMTGKSVLGLGSHSVSADEARQKIDEFEAHNLEPKT